MSKSKSKSKAKSKSHSKSRGGEKMKTEPQTDGVSTEAGDEPDIEALVQPLGDTPAVCETIEISGDVAQVIEQLEAERDEAVDGRKRALAEFANFQKRAVKSEAGARKQGEANVVRSLLTVLDHFELALGQDSEALTVEQLRDGVGLVRSELVQALEGLGLSRIEPDSGEEFDPNRHEAMLRQESEDVGPGCVVAVFQPGYAMGDLVLRPAKVSVSPCPDDE